MASCADHDSELVWNAAHEAVKQFADSEPSSQVNKLEKKVRDYFRKAAKGLDFGRRSWKQLVNDYADAALASIFTTFGGRPWLDEADFLLVLDAGVKEFFPKQQLANLSQLTFEQTVLEAYNRAFDEQRFSYILWDTIKAMVSGQQSKKRVYNAIEHGRKTASAKATASGASGQGHKEVEDFVRNWIQAAVSCLAQSGNASDLSWILPLEQAVRLFQSLLHAGALPLDMHEEYGPPPSNWSFAAKTVDRAYAAYSGRRPAGGASQLTTDGRAGASPLAKGSSLRKYQMYRNLGKGKFGKGQPVGSFYLGSPRTSRQPSEGTPNDDSWLDSEEEEPEIFTPQQQQLENDDADPGSDAEELDFDENAASLAYWPPTKRRREARG